MIQRRRSLITQILSTNGSHTQEHIVHELHTMGVTATQATISRDLAALGAIRGPEGYQLGGSPQRADAMSDDLSALLRSHALKIEPANSIVVIKTAPGHAQLLAVGFDRSPPTGIVGCLAGDDTIFLATTSPKTATSIIKMLKAQLG